MIQLITKVVPQIAIGTVSQNWISPLSFTRWTNFEPDDPGWGANATVSTPWPTTGSMQNWLIETQTILGSGQTLRYQLYIDGVLSALDLTFTEGETVKSYILPIDVTRGQLVYLTRTTTGTPTLAPERFTYEYVNSGNKSIAGTNGLSGGSDGEGWSVFNPIDIGENLLDDVRDVIGVPGNLTYLTGRLTPTSSVEPGASMTLTLYVDDAPTAVALEWGPGDIVAEWSGMFPLAFEATTYFVLSTSGTIHNLVFGLGVEFDATASGVFAVNGNCSGFGNTETEFAQPLTNSLVNEWSTNEALAQANASVSRTFVVSGLTVWVSDESMGVGTFTFSVNVNGVNPAGAPEVLIDETTTLNSDDGDMTIAPDDLWNVTVTPMNAPASPTNCCWSMGLALDVPPDPPDPPDPPAAPTTTETLRMRRLRRATHLSTEQLRTFFQMVQLDCEMGVGLTTGQGSDPQVMLRWSDDGGHTWSEEHWVSAGLIGQYARRAMWWRLGVARDRVFEIVVSDPVRWRLLDMYLQAEQGSN